MNSGDFSVVSRLFLVIWKVLLLLSSVALELYYTKSAIIQ
jgi:hypothetical protein